MDRLKTTLLCVCVLAASAAMADDFWNSPFDKWSREQVQRILRDSPWAQSQTFTGVINGKNAGYDGEKELYYRFTVRFFSALPVREAYVRMARLMNNYDQMAEDQRKEFDVRFQKALALDVSDRVIIAVDYPDTNDPNAARELRSAFEMATTDTMKQRVYLIGQKVGRVQIRDYFPPSSDGTGAKFIFPRTVNGQPVVGSQDKEVRFDFTSPATNQHIFMTFKAQKMLFQGQPSY